jgi:hypothetical protein
MDPLFLFISEVMFERVDEMNEIIEHPLSLRAGGLSYSPYVRHYRGLIPRFR